MKSSGAGMQGAQSVPVEDDEGDSGPSSQPASASTRRPATGSSSGVQRVSIEEEPGEAATGETTRLDQNT
jgi:hypothetical protein